MSARNTNGNAKDVLCGLKMHTVVVLQTQSQAVGKSMTLYRKHCCERRCNMAKNLDAEAFMVGYEKGMRDAVMMREDADGCKGCAFEDVESWQPPCTLCKRNHKDYWRSKKV